MDFDDNLSQMKPILNTNIRRSISSITLTGGNQNLALREAKSLTEKICKMPCNIEEHNSEGNKYFHTQLFINGEKSSGKMNELVYETREVTSNQIFWVKEEMLTYRGKRYSLSDIATKWKKDCRMWLWKSNKIKNKSVGELRDKLLNVKIHS